MRYLLSVEAPGDVGDGEYKDYYAVAHIKPVNVSRLLRFKRLAQELVRREAAFSHLQFHVEEGDFTPYIYFYTRFSGLPRVLGAQLNEEFDECGWVYVPDSVGLDAANIRGEVEILEVFIRVDREGVSWHMRETVQDELCSTTPLPWQIFDI